MRFVIPYYHKIFIFAVLERWLIYDCETECSFVYLMLFNIDKCKVLHLGYTKYCVMEATQLQEVSEERDLEIIVGDDLKWEKQYTAAVKQVTSFLDGAIGYGNLQSCQRPTHNVLCFNRLQLFNEASDYQQRAFTRAHHLAKKMYLTELYYALNINSFLWLLTTHQPQYLHESISVQPCHNTRSSCGHSLLLVHPVLFESR